MNSLEHESSDVALSPSSVYSTKLKYKSLIRDKVLKPSKMSCFDAVRAHHAHLVIRDSHYLLKSPTSFITCASCHRGRVLKIGAIKQLTTEEILYEIYSTIGRNPCQKRKNTAREQQVLPRDQRAEIPLPMPQQQQHSIHKTQVPLQEHHNIDRLNRPPQPLHSIPMMYSTSYQPTYYPLLPQQQHRHQQPKNDPGVGAGYPLPPSLPQIQQHQLHLGQLPQLHKIPSFADLFADFEPLENMPQFAENMSISSVGSSIKVTSFTLASLFNSDSNFPALLDCFLSLAVKQNFNEFYSPDTLIIPLPTYACTMFMKDPEANLSFFRTDDNLIRTLSTRINQFVQQRDFNPAKFKVVILFNYFMERTGNRLQDQSPRYIGNMYVLNEFQTMDDSSLSFINSRYASYHDQSSIDVADELSKAKLFNELIISKLQNEVFLKTNQMILGTHINALCLEKQATTTAVTYITDSDFVMSPSSSLFIICFISLKLLRLLMTSAEGLQSLGYLCPISFNEKFHLYILKLMLEQLKSHEHKQDVRSLPF